MGDASRQEMKASPVGQPNSTVRGDDQTRLIVPPGRWPTIDLNEVWAARELLWVFVKRGIFTRYRQMALGVLWSFLEPLGLLVLVSIVFGFFIRVPTGGFPYPIFVFAAFIPWLYFSKATNGAASSLAENIGIISKIYFPRAILPLAAIIREYIDSMVFFVLLAGVSWFYGYPPTIKFLLMPILLLFLSLPALGIGMSVAAISVKYRDFRPVLTLTLQAGFYASPIFYPAELVPDSVRPYYELNPVYWFIEISRWIVLDKPLVLTPSLGAAFILTVAGVAAGYFLFALFERQTVDAQ